MKWEPVENAAMLNEGDVVIGWVEVSEGFNNYETFIYCGYMYGELVIIDPDINQSYTITHFMVIEEPDNENTKSD